MSVQASNFYHEKNLIKAKIKIPIPARAGMGIEMVLCVKLHQKLMR